MTLAEYRALTEEERSELDTSDVWQGLFIEALTQLETALAAIDARVTALENP
jgi:hypothetical protein